MSTLPERVATLETQQNNLAEKINGTNKSNRESNDRVWEELHLLRKEQGIKSRGVKGWFLIGGIFYAIATGNWSDLKETFIELFKP